MKEPVLKAIELKEQGLSNKEIARRMKVGVETVENYLLKAKNPERYRKYHRKYHREHYKKLKRRKQFR